MAQPLVPDSTTVADAWRAMHDANTAQATRLSGPNPDDYWAPLVPRFSVGDEPRELPTVAPLLQPDDTVLDVGAGAARFSAHSAPLVGSVTACEGSPAMSEGLRRAADSIPNLSALPTTSWPPAEPVDLADVVFCSHVVYYVPDIAPFLAAFEAHARRLCIIVAGDRAGAAPPPDVFNAVHGEPYAELPALNELVQLLTSRGTHYEVRRVPGGSAQGQVQGGMDPLMLYRRRCLVQEGTPADDRLRQILASRDPDDMASYSAFTSIAVVSWEPRSSLDS